MRSLPATEPRSLPAPLLTAAFRDAPSGLLVTDLEGAAVEVNRALCRLLRRTPDQIVGRREASFTHPADLQRDAGARRQLAEGRRRAITYTKRLIRADGSLVPVRVTLDLVDELATGERWFLAHVHEAIDAPRANRRGARREDGAGDQVDLLGAFAAVAAHELSAPVGLIRAHEERLRERLRDERDPEVEKHLHQIADAAERVRALLDGLVELSPAEGESPAGEEVDCAALVAAIVDELEGARARAGVAVDVGPLPAVRGAGAQLRLVFANLIANAVKFAPAGGHVAVRAERNPGAWTFVVADDGPGIPPSQRNRIFDLFTRLDRTVPGSGIGLALAKRVVRRHGGRIWVEDNTGTGSRFCFTLPDEREPA